MTIAQGMALALSRAKKAGIAPVPTACPECGGKLVVEHRACFKPKYAFAVGCTAKDCLWAYGPSVRKAILNWNAINMSGAASELLKTAHEITETFSCQ